MKKPEFIFLDAICTLMDVTPNFVGFFQAMAEAEGVRPDPKVLRCALDEAFRKDHDRLSSATDFSTDVERERAFWRKVDAEVFRGIGIDEGRAAEMADKAFDEFESGRLFRVYDETVPALRRIREMEIPMGIVSNGTPGMDRWMRSCAFAPFMEFILVSVVVGWEKPGREIFELALDRGGVGSTEALFVGDNYLNDIVGAQRAGIAPVWITGAPDGKAPGCPTISHIGELPDLLESFSE